MDALAPILLLAAGVEVTVYSKFKYKSMTYDLYAESKNINNHHKGSSGTSSYLLSPEGEEPYWAERKQTLTGSRNIENTVPVTFRASYDSENFQMKNTVGFTYTGKPANDNDGTVEFSPELFEASTYRTEKNSEVKSVTYNGTFYFTFPRQYDLSLYPFASYTLNKQESLYTTDETSILNNALEKANSFYISANLRKGLGNNHYLFLSGLLPHQWISPGDVQSFYTHRFHTILSWQLLFFRIFQFSPHKPMVELRHYHQDEKLS